MIHFRILDETLCGADYKEPSKKVAKDGRLCDDCIQVMWREQYRRNTLTPYVRKASKSKPKAEPVEEHEIEEITTRGNGLFLADYRLSDIKEQHRRGVKSV
tara:strand:+ start:370 stop:672 length:303 start_codon:yes stop_codon:yes gene_type:complete